MSWKTVLVVVATLAYGATLTAQGTPSDPFLGIWEINLAKTVNYPNRSQTLVNVPAPGGGFTSTRASIAQDGKSGNVELHPVVFDGKPHATSGGDAREIAYKLIDPYTLERTHNRSGKITVDTTVISKDGKTMTVTQPGGVVRVYDKTFNVTQPAR